MPNTMTLIATSTVGAGGASGINFTSIPATYTDLLITISTRISYAGVIAGLYANFNNDYTNGNYSRRALSGNGSSVSSTSGASFIQIGLAPGNNSTSNTFGNASLYIPNYAGSTTKSASVDNVTENNASEAYQWITAGLWNSTAAINSINIYSDGGNHVQYATASLYGILKGSGGASVS